MFFRNRPDGTRVRNAPSVRLFMPFLMPRRNDSVVYFEQKIDVSQTQDYLKRWKTENPKLPLRLFHLYIAAGVRTLHDRPRLNRFIAGKRLYQRNAIDLSISVLKAKHDDAELTVVKQRFDPEDGLLDTRAKVEEILSTGRQAEKTSSEREVSLLTKLPRWFIPLLFKLQRFGDYTNLLPASLIENDPLYASAIISHLGSIGLDPAYHHLYEHGTLPIFMVIGKIRKEPIVTPDGDIEVRPIVTVRFSFDERVADGLYAAKAMVHFRRLVEKPWLLEQDEDNGPGAPD
jgi:hypothetical protein